MDLIKGFDQTDKNDVPEAGGKGASLGEMTRAGIPIPPGFVILANAFERFIEEIELAPEIDTILHTVKTGEMSSVEHASERIQRLILSAQMPDDIGKEIQRYFNELDASFVAVRSSATAEDSASAAWAGQLDSYLNTTEETLLTNVQRCWASLFTPRAIFYRFEKELHKQKISVAVVVQKMVQSEISGIAFSVHPVTEDYNQLIIEAGFGLGEAIVSGQVTPDSYVIEKNPRRIIEKNITYQSKALWRAANGGNEWRQLSQEEGSKPTLSDEQALELAEVILRIERHYGFPCDIEWTYEAGQFYIVQSRPITTLSLASGGELKKNLNESTVNLIKNTDWHSDWSGPFSLFGLSLPTNTYFEGMERYFGKGLSQVFVVFKNGVAFSRLPSDEYHELGAHLVERAQNREFVKKWASQFKKCADILIGEMPESPEEFIEKLPELLPHYQAYGAHNAATKIAFDAGYNRLSKKTKDILEEARKYSETFYKDDAENIDKAIRFLSKKTGYAYEEVYMLTYEELLSYLAGGSLPLQTELKERWIAAGVYFTKDKAIILSPKELAGIERSRLSDSDKREIVGQSAYKGKVQGRCRIILDYKNAVFGRGDVLVTGMTDPHFVELMKKAAAIVTDGGGMLSHAAIVARELKKPCVIGTKIATQVLKDGDLVEVDADNGVVKILECAEKEIVNTYVGEVDESDTKTLTKIFSRNMPLYAYYIWHEDILKCQPFWVGEKVLTHHLVVSDITEATKASIYYNLGQINKAYRLYRDRLMQAGSFIKLFPSFVSNFKKAEKAGTKLEKHTNLENFYEFIDVFMHWYHGEMAAVHSTPDMVGISESIKNEALELRAMTQDLTANFAVIVCDTVEKLFPQYKGYGNYLLPDEVSKIETLCFDDMETKLKERKKGWFLYNMVLYTDRKRLSGILLKNDVVIKSGEQHQDYEKLVGQIVSKGIGKGKVRVIKTKNDLTMFNKGEVLVTEMTYPDYVPQMKMAAGVVTDEGGITCHAAIVSRELKIPCVVGTKIATQVLKDGDLVEVDANNGVVRILERKE